MRKCTIAICWYSSTIRLMISIHHMMEKFDQRRKLIHKGLNDLPGVTCSMPGGAFYAFPNVSGTW